MRFPVLLKEEGYRKALLSVPYVVVAANMGNIRGGGGVRDTFNLLHCDLDDWMWWKWDWNVLCDANCSCSNVL